MIAIKYVMLFLVALQTSCMVLALRYTRTVHVSGPRYLTSTVVVVAECIKSLTCLFIVLYQAKFQLQKFRAELWDGIFGNPIETLKIAVPSGIYAIQNNLLFIALNYLDAPIYQVTYQLKILTTALFSVILLKRALAGQQWIALLMLMIGVALVQMPSEVKQSDVSMNNRFLGLIVLLIACFSSGFAGVYFELLLKGSSLSLWIRNIQMAVFGIIFATITALASDWKQLSQDGFFQGYNKPVMAVVFLQAYGGLVVSCAVRYADNILKGFATSISIIISSVASFFLFEDFKLTSLFIIGTMTVLSATFLYGWKPSKSNVKSK